MTESKLHHYVPRFYLRRFADSDGMLWIWNRDTDRTFQTRPNSIAAERSFYRLAEFKEAGYDPLAMEKQLGDCEAQTSRITGQWIDWISAGDPLDCNPIPAINREIVSLYITLQILRTANARTLFVELARSAGQEMTSDAERRALHTSILWDDQIIADFKSRLSSYTWLFAANRTSTPFITSDNPVALRSSDNRRWRDPALLGNGAYIVFPLSPSAMMYCYPNEDPWERVNLSRFDSRISPVTLTDELVASDNLGQVFNASRFVISNRNRFDNEREFARTIGTDLYAPKGTTLFE